jgi:hypothetical protein
MDLKQMRSILDQIDAARIYVYFKTKQQGMEVWMVTDFIEDKRVFMSKEKAAAVVRELNNKITIAHRAVSAYTKNAASVL